VPTDGVQAVRAGLGGQLQPRHCPLEAVRLVAVLAQEQVGAGVDHHVHACCVGGLAQPADECGVLLGRANSLALLVHRVLDVEANGTHREQPLDETLGRLAVPRLDVHRDRYVDRTGDLRDARRQVVERHHLAVLLADRVGDRMAAHGQCAEPRVDRQLRRPGVPHGRQDHRRTRHVQRQQRCREVPQIGLAFVLGHLFISHSVT
jgi:hypothetical protein